jgi:zinc transport system ATP-binding protein
MVIDHVSFSLNSRSITTLVGPNGAGKSTIARLILGIEKPTSGKIYKGDIKCAYIPQKISLNYNIPLDVKSLISYLSGTNFDHNSHLSSFGDVNLLHQRGVHELSGGELQKVFIVAAILSTPDLIVLDEPTQGLDIQSQSDLYNLLDRIRNELNTTIFMISHDLHTVMQKSDKVLCLNHHICCSGKPQKKEGSNLSEIGIYNHHHDHVH